MQRPKSTHTATFDAAEVRTKEVTGSSCPVRRGKKGTSTSRSSRRSGFCDHHDALVVGLAAPHQRRRNNWILRGTEASSSLGAPSRKKLVSCRKKSSWCTTILRTTNRLHGQHTGYFFTPSRSSCSSSSRLDLLFSTVLLFAVLVMLLFIDDRPVVLALQQTYGQRKKRGNLRGAYRYLDDQVNSKRATENSVVGSSVPPGDEQTGSNKNAQDDLSSSGSATTAADPPDKEILSDKLLELQASGESDHVEEELQQFETANQATSSGVGENTRPSSFASLREKRLLPGERAALSTTEVESPRVFSGGSASSSSSSRKLNQLRNQIAADQLDELSSTAASSGTSSAGDPRHASSSGTGEDAEVREQLQFVNDQRGKPLGPGRTGENGGAGTSSENAFSFVELAQPAQDRRATEPSTATGGENAVPEGTSSSDVEEDANEATRRKTRRKSEDLAPKAGAPARKHPRSPNRRTSSAMQVRQGASTSRNQHDEQDSTVSKADGDPSSMMQLRNLSEEKEEEILQRAAEGYWSDSPRNIEGAGATSSKSSSSAGSSSALQLAEQELKREYEDAAYQHEEHRQHHHQHAAARSKVQGKPKSKEKGDSKSKAKKKKKEKEGEPVRHQQEKHLARGKLQRRPRKRRSRRPQGPHRMKKLPLQRERLQRELTKQKRLQRQRERLQRELTKQKRRPRMKERRPQQMRPRRPPATRQRPPRSQPHPRRQQRKRIVTQTTSPSLSSGWLQKRRSPHQDRARRACRKPTKKRCRPPSRKMPRSCSKKSGWELRPGTSGI
ncbi:unnamed protein product [Amoebophrya sp. A120]|nr:unnamed protein product [Amoebophrya sp. A120]|eukprot:GSA120T00006149001.1